MTHFGPVLSSPNSRKRAAATSTDSRVIGDEIESNERASSAFGLRVTSPQIHFIP